VKEAEQQECKCRNLLCGIVALARFLFFKQNTTSRYGRKGNLIYDHEEKCGFPFADFTEIISAQKY
jgi:hypothetical protein